MTDLLEAGRAPDPEGLVLAQSPFRFLPVFGQVVTKLTLVVRPRRLAGDRLI